MVRRHVTERKQAQARAQPQQEDEGEEVANEAQKCVPVFIDALSSGSAGMRFANYYVQPICTPTRSVLMSGRYSI
eukprot:COSAG05_NODE_22453_length_265_cov_0.439759_1_plen_74_part_10